VPRSHAQLSAAPAWSGAAPVPERQNVGVPADPVPHRLFLLRHAMTSWNQPGAPDHDRPLAPRGQRCLPGVAATIDGHLDGPLDLVLASTATRVRDTLAGVLPRISAPHDLCWRRGLYLASPEYLFAELNELPDDVRTVLLCGHNPGLHQLALDLLGDSDGSDTDGAASAGVWAGLPPAGLVVIDVDDAWADVGAGSGRLVEFAVPPEA